MESQIGNKTEPDTEVRTQKIGPDAETRKQNKEINLELNKQNKETEEVKSQLSAGVKVKNDE